MYTISVMSFLLKHYDLIYMFGIKSDVVSSICLRLTGKLNVMEQNICVQQMLSMQSDGVINVEKCQKIICNV